MPESDPAATPYLIAMRQALARSPLVPVALSGTPTVALPPHVVEAVLRGTASTGYPDPQGLEPLRAAIADALVREGLEVAGEHVVVTAGALQALSLSMRLFAHGGEVLQHAPGFFLDGIARSSGSNVVPFSTEQGSDRPDWSAAEAAITPATRMLYVNTPVNPTGYVFDQQDRDAVQDLVIRHGLWLISDEAHTRFVYDGLAHVPVWHPSIADRTITIRSFSKDFGMAGWRVGYAVLPAAVVDDFAAALEFQTATSNVLGQAGALAALNGPQDWVSAMAAAAGSRRRSWVDALNALPGVSAAMPGGGLSVFPRVPDSQAFARRLVEELAIPAVPGERFGAPGRVRLQFGGTDLATREALDRIAGLNRLDGRATDERCEGIQPPTAQP